MDRSEATMLAISVAALVTVLLMAVMAFWW
jgi:hypothetical protein